MKYNSKMCNIFFENILITGVMQTFSLLLRNSFFAQPLANGETVGIIELQAHKE